jgi:Flp pilus assembly protein TadD
MNALHRVRPVMIVLLLAGGTALAGCAHLVLLHDPLTASEHNDLGVAYESSGQPDLAAREYRHSLRLDAHQSRTRVNLGNVQAAKGEWRSAEKSYRRALRDSVTNTDAMNNLAVAMLRQGRGREEARALAERAVAMGGERDSIYRATLAEAKANAIENGTTSK